MPPLFQGYGAMSPGDRCPPFQDSVVISSSRVTCPISLDMWPLNMGPAVCPETSSTSHPTTQYNIPEQQRPQLCKCESLKSHILILLTTCHDSLNFPNLTNINRTLSLKSQTHKVLQTLLNHPVHNLLYKHKNFSPFCYSLRHM